MTPHRVAALVLLLSAQCFAAPSLEPAPTSAPSVDAGPHAAPADSDESLRHFTDRIVTVQGAIGLGTIVGNTGVVGVLTPHERVSLVAGVGLTPWGVQWGAGLRLRAMVWPRQKTVQALTIAPGFTMGNWQKLGDHFEGEPYDCEGSGNDRSDGDDCNWILPDKNYYIRHIDHARWVQLDVGYEMRTRKLSVFAGPFLAMVLNPEDCVIGESWNAPKCSEETTPLDRDSVPLAFGISAFVGF